MVVGLPRWTGREAGALRAGLGLTIEQFAERLDVSTRTVSYWEARGTGIIPVPCHQGFLDTVLGRARPEERQRFYRLVAGQDMTTRHRRGQAVAGSAGPFGGTIDSTADGLGGDPTDRREFLNTGLGFGAAALIACEASRSTAVDGLLAVVPTVYRRLETSTPSRLLLAPVRVHTDLVEALVPTAGEDSTRAALWRIASEAAGLAAWLHADLDEPAHARAAYRRAVNAAEASGHALLTIYMRASYGHFLATSGASGPGLSLIRASRETAGVLPPAPSAWLDAVEAVAAAGTGDEQALGLLDRATATVDASQVETVWPWLFPFTPVKLTCYRAAVGDRLGRSGEARSAYAMAGGTGSRKQRALTTANHASFLARDGDPEAACALAVRALRDARETGSVRVVRSVSDLRTRISGLPPTATEELDHVLTECLQEEL